MMDRTRIFMELELLEMEEDLLFFFFGEENNGRRRVRRWSVCISGSTSEAWFILMSPTLLKWSPTKKKVSLKLLCLYLKRTVACAHCSRDTQRTDVGGGRQLNYFTVTLLTLCR